MDLPRTSQGLIKWTGKTLWKVHKEVYDIDRDVRPWRICVLCRAPARFTCGRCGHILHQDRIPYCSRACQQKHWPMHKKDCKRLVEREASRAMGLGRDLSVMKLILREERQQVRWSEILNNSRVPRAIVAQARFTLGDAGLDYPNSCFHFELELVDPNNPKSPLWPVAFEWKPMVWKPSDSPMPKDPKELQWTTHYKIFIGGTERKQRRFSIAKFKEYDGPENPYWPWIFAHCCVSGDLVPNLCTIRMEILMKTIEEAIPTTPKLQQFALKKRFQRFEINQEDFDE